ncbi:MAG: SprT family zinc-dependent metalloprotease [Syntrophus sp. (in: bacteria)]
MDLTYQLVRSKKRKKTLSLTVKPGGMVVIQAPYPVPRAEIDGFFQRKLPWIRQKMATLARQVHREMPGGEALAAGDQALLLGVPYPVIINGINLNGSNLSFDGSRFILSPCAAASGKDSLRSWYQQTASSFLPDRVSVYEEIMGCNSRSVRISRARSRWGSCSADNRIALSWRLMMAPPAIIDYVVVHELAHIREKNHSPRFWSLVGNICPDYRKHRRWLRIEGNGLFL